MTFGIAIASQGASWFRLSVGESLLRASKDALHKLKTFAGSDLARRPQRTLLSNGAACSRDLLRPGGRPLTAPAVAENLLRESEDPLANSILRWPEPGGKPRRFTTR